MKALKIRIGLLSRLEWITTISLIIVVSAIFAGCPSKSNYFKPTGGEVHGMVVVRLDSNFETGKQGSKIIPIPDITVYLRNTSNYTLSSKVTTGIDGRYVIPTMPNGNYHLILEGDGYNTDSATTVIINNEIYSVNMKSIFPKRGIITGNVLLKDKLPSFCESQIFKVFFYTEISLSQTIGSSTIKKVRANFLGDFIIPDVPNGNYTVTAIAENASISSNVTLNGRANATLIVPNSNPNVNGVQIFNQGNSPLRNSGIGTTVVVKAEATDPDGDPIHYFWFASGSTGTFNSIDNATINWTLPSDAGIYTIYALAVDKRGGKSVQKAEINVGATKVLFSGTVKDNFGALVSNATVVVNGIQTSTAASGYFTLQVDDGNRFVINIEKLGYALLSKISYSPVVNGKFKLIKASETTIDPTKDNVIQEKPDSLKGNENEKTLSSVSIKANTIVDKSGNKVTTPVHVYSRSTDLRDPDQQIVGDYGALNNDGKEVQLTSYGALDVQLTDAGGNPLNLLSGSQATINMGVDPLQMNNPNGAPPSTIDLWSYDKVQGLWIQEGIAILNGNLYKATVKHFSVFNTDVQFTDAACLRLLANPLSPLSVSVATPVSIRVTIPTGSGVDKVKTFQVTELPGVIARLPPGKVIRIQILDNAGNPRTGTGMDQSVPTGGAIPGTAATSFTSPYSECLGRAFLPGAGYPNDAGGVFLNYVSNDEAEANAYYRAIGAFDASNNPSFNFSQWKTDRGFNSASDDLASAVYFNAGDLGFWRGMHARRVDATHYYFYVTNYRTDVDDIGNTGAIATVCMDYSPGTGGGAPFTKFYVFNGAGNMVNNADLDGYGAKFVPELCVTCHGGNQALPLDGSGNLTDPNIGSKFIPFDVGSFGESPLNTLASQYQQFYNLNHLVGQIEKNRNGNSEINDPMIDLIKGWYNITNVDNAPASFTPHDLPSDPANYFVPSLWTSQANVYKTAFATSCRTCHITRSSGKDWDKFSELHDYGIDFYVCTGKVMPNAKIPFENFWLGEDASHVSFPSLFHNAGLLTSCP